MFESFMKWYESIWGHDGQVQSAVRTIKDIPLPEMLDKYYNDLPENVRTDPAVVTSYMARLDEVAGVKQDLRDPLAKFIEGALKDWVAKVGNLEGTTPEESTAKLADISAKVLEMFAASAAIDIGLGMLPNGAGEASTNNSKELLKWLGFGAVLAAVAHDPVKIGLLRPYQDHLEATFRNRRPEYVGILNAYRQRSLSTTVVTDTDSITDELMDTIEQENDANMDFYGAQWGYPQKWITIEKDASTKAMTFGNLMAMARLGYYDRGMSIFSLWTFGIDRRLMKSALKAIETSRDVGMWKGFRSMVEPSFVQGLIEAEDLTSYWTKILVPQDVQDWAMIRLTKSREKFAAKELRLENAASKDLTKSDWMQAYERNIISVDELKKKLTALGYDDLEIDILVRLADSKKVGPTSTACKHLPLTDYELAHRNGILTLDQVLARMQGEYCQADIDLEKQLLEISDLTSDAPAAERDLSVSKITEVYADNDITKPQLDEYLIKLGFDDQERSWLITLADIKKTAADAKTKGNNGKNGIIKERDLTLAQLTAAYVQNVIDEASYTTDIGILGYDASEVAILLKLAQIKKKLPSVEGLKRLPLGDYEKAWKLSLLTSDQVIERMQGEYRDEDIQLERLLLAAGRP